MLVPRRGRILFDGQPIDHMPTYKRVEIGISIGAGGPPGVPQPHGAREPHDRRLPEPQRALEHRHHLRAVPPARSLFKKRQAAGLSGGEQQALAIGRALMANPRLILMDEVSLGLAPVVIKRIYDAFPTLLDSNGCTILVVEQDVQHVLTVATHVACFLEGRIALQGLPERAYQRTDNRGLLRGVDYGMG